MTDLAARLRDVLSDDQLDLAFDDILINDSPKLLAAMRERLTHLLLPHLSSLLEEREREIRERFRRAIRRLPNPIHEVGASGDASDWWTCSWCGSSWRLKERHNDDCLWGVSRLASSSSPAAPQEQK